ncbi:MAG: exodeoxyribonuclease VII large subunit [Sulfurisoma sp.]|nr:exodeoxyribonuclease VII large subunit [Sulfurisoma sp.]
MTSNLPEVISVSELNRRVRASIERALPPTWIAGEVSNLTRAASGHVYFTLKDAAAQVRCVMFRSRAQVVPWRLENGQQVEASALASLYEPRGDFQLNVEALRRAGLGQLFEAFLRLREKLATEGLFDAERKRELPRYPRRVGIVTSKQAAALRDVVAAFARRAPNVELIVYPTLVQGAEAPAAIVAALETAARRDECELLLLVRGGGSLEDLLAFNDEAVARAIAVSPAPTICGVGHETDTTIADYVADRRAATPTAAAELATAGWFAAVNEIKALAAALRDTMQYRVEALMQRIDLLGHRLAHPAQRLHALRQRLDHLASRLAAAGNAAAQTRRRRLQGLQLRLRPPQPGAHRRTVEHLRNRLARATAAMHAQRATQLARLQSALAALNPRATLARGFAIVRDDAGAIVRDASQVAKDSAIRLQFEHGSAAAIVTQTFPD